MKNFEWDNSLALGIPNIDKQHKMLFEWVNGLNDTIKREDGYDKTQEMIFNLINYVTVHFSEEERLMQSFNYPQLPAHRKEHDKFVSRLQSIQARFISEQEIGDEVLEMMKEWLVNHIKGTDQGYNRFMHESGSKEGG